LSWIVSFFTLLFLYRPCFCFCSTMFNQSCNTCLSSVALCRVDLVLLRLAPPWILCFGTSHLFFFFLHCPLVPFRCTSVLTKKTPPPPTPQAGLSGAPFYGRSIFLPPTAASKFFRSPSLPKKVSTFFPNTRPCDFCLFHVQFIPPFFPFGNLLLKTIFFEAAFSRGYCSRQSPPLILPEPGRLKTPWTEIFVVVSPPPAFPLFPPA